MTDWWRDLRLSSKLGLCGLSFLVPIALLLALLLGQMSRDIRITRTEMDGIAAVAPIEDTIELAADHLIISMARFKGEDVRDRQERNLASTRESRSELARMLTEHAAKLGLERGKLQSLALPHLEPQEFIKRLEALAESRSASPLDSLARHEQYVDLLAEMRNYLADSAKLVLDPEISSYYLMYVLLFDIPRAQEVLGGVTGLGYLALSGLPEAEQARTLMDNSRGNWDLTVTKRIMDKLEKAQRSLSGDKLSSLTKAAQAYSDASRTFLDLSRAVAARDPKVTLEAYIASGIQARKAGAALWDLCHGVFAGLLEERTGELRRNIALVLGVSLTCIALTALLAWTAVISVTRPLSRVARVATTIAEGKVALAARLLDQACPTGSCSRERLLAGSRSRSETSQLFAAMAVMIHALEQLLGAVSDTGARLQSSSARIAATARQLEAAATAQAASTVEVGATSKEISSTAGELADTMGEVLGVATRSSELATEGRESLARMGQAMEGLSGASREMAAKLSLIREKASGIGQLLTTIGKVAAQTNLLSLNAAIEAEKAGEFGPGFAVVAREIRRLADQTASAALDIEKTIRDMQASVQAGAAAMDGFTSLTADTAEASRSVNAKLGRIIEAGEELTPRVSTVTGGMRLQAEGADQISVVISQLADSAGETRDSLAEFRRAAEELTATAAGLKELLGRFESGN